MSLNILNSRFRPSVPSAYSPKPAMVRDSKDSQGFKGIFRLHNYPHIAHNNPFLTHPMTHKSRTDDALGDNVASITKYKNKWRALINKNGIRKSKVFQSKTAAKDWATRFEHEIGEGKGVVDQNRILADVLARYRDNESVKKRSARWEVKKIDHIIGLLGSVKVSELDTPRMVEWRDSRMKAVSNSTVNREWNLLNVIFNTAVKQWHWLPENPLSAVSRPPNPPARDRLISPDEIELITHTTGFKDCPSTIQSRVGAAFLFAIETAMRAGEILSLTPETVDLENRVADLPMTKNGTSRRVPLSSEAINILRIVSCDFDMTSRQLDSNFRKCRDMAGIKGLTFHDTRHQAITNLASKLGLLELARMTGIKDLKILNVYYNKTAEEIAKKLD